MLNRRADVLLAMLGTPVAKAKKKASSGEETKARIIGATLATLKEEGIVGTSARAIARAGDFNQALIFYHFGSVDDVIVAAVTQMSSRRMENHRSKLEETSSLPDLIRVARQLHADDSSHDNMTVLTQALAGGLNNPDMSAKLYANLEPWSEMVADAIERVLADNPVASALPHRQIADAISALFLGIELLDDLNPAVGHADAMFDSLQSLAELLDDLLLASPLLEMFRNQS